MLCLNPFSLWWIDFRIIYQTLIVLQTWTDDAHSVQWQFQEIAIWALTAQ